MAYQPTHTTRDALALQWLPMVLFVFGRLSRKGWLGDMTADEAVSFGVEHLLAEAERDPGAAWTKQAVLLGVERALIHGWRRDRGRRRTKRLRFFSELDGLVDDLLVTHDPDPEEYPPEVLRLGTRDRDLITATFWRSLTQAEIAAEFGVTRQRVQQLVTRAMSRLRTEYHRRHDHDSDR